MLHVGFGIHGTGIDDVHHLPALLSFEKMKEMAVMMLSSRFLDALPQSMRRMHVNWILYHPGDTKCRPITVGGC